MKTPSQTQPEPAHRSNSPLLGLLVAAFYALFTLLPDSNTLVVSWPWVFLWQVALICPLLWLLAMMWQRHQLPKLGHGFDAIAILTAIGLFVSSVTSEFRHQAQWSAWAALCFLLALYALHYWLQSSPQRRHSLLVGQGYLNVAFIAVSLSVWLTQTFLPTLNNLQQLQQYGVQRSFDLVSLEQRNWAPIGHPNYVAGYLVLALPLLLGLAVVEKNWRRWLWSVGLVLGLVDLYTTGSRGGWLGLVAAVIFGLLILVWRSALPRRWLGLGAIVLLGSLIFIGFTNIRLRNAIASLSSGQVNSDTAFRLITATTGWHMGRDHLWLGAGPGTVPLLYQQYRPIWAGREAELVYQLHNTPVQIWAELGIWGIGATIAAIALLGYVGWRWLRSLTQNPDSVSKNDQILTASLSGGFIAYLTMSLTDYQLDNICISGTLIVFLAVLISEFQTLVSPQKIQSTTDLLSQPHIQRGAIFGTLGILVAVTVWLAPIHAAWNFSSQGFAALSAKNIDRFVEHLSQAHQLAPWESYYSYQLGWNLGDRSLQTTEPQQKQQLTISSIAWFQKGLQASPHQEFGHTNLAWLLLNVNPQQATAAFAQSARLIPAKRGVFHGLGLSLFAQGKTDLAVQAMTLEILRDPLLITSPVWQSPQLQSLYTATLQQLIAQCNTFLQSYPETGSLNHYLHQIRGGFSWWQGNITGNASDWANYGTPIQQLILKLVAGESVQIDLEKLPPSSSTLAIAAWLNPTQRSTLLQQAWVHAEQANPPVELLQTLVTGMNQSATFDQWLKQNAPVRQYRRTRQGFGALSRHIDGPAPTDFPSIIENVAIARLLPELFPSPPYIPEWDLMLQSPRQALLQAL